jgi:pimeloyl-ACP methyl ester carboxylesterase
MLGSILAAAIAATAVGAGPATAEPSAAAAPAQASLAGEWGGVLDAGAAKLRLKLTIADEGGKLSAVMDSLDQGAKLPVASIEETAGEVVFTLPAIGGRYEGVLDPTRTVLTGTWSQGGASLPLTLTKGVAPEAPKRPQTPQPPFPYRVDEVTIPTPTPGVTLAGTLTLPEGPGPFPAAVLISGSGPQDRDETLLGHKPFLVLADHLTRRGIAVLRYDDRGVAKSTGDFGAATTADFAVDAAAAAAWLRARPEIDTARVGLIGHSEGGLIAPLVASRDDRVAWTVLLAGPAVPGEAALVEQAKRIALATGAPAEAVAAQNAVFARAVAAVVAHADDPEAARREAEAVLVAAGTPKAQAEAAASQFATPWFRHFLTYDPAPALRDARGPMLALYGEKDLQVPPEQSAPVLKRLRPTAEVEVLPSLNHLFQTATTGSPQEYAQIEQTMAPTVLDRIAGWILEQPPARR